MLALCFSSVAVLQCNLCIICWLHVILQSPCFRAVVVLYCRCCVTLLSVCNFIRLISRFPWTKTTHPPLSALHFPFHSTSSPGALSAVKGHLCTQGSLGIGPWVQNRAIKVTIAPGLFFMVSITSPATTVSFSSLPPFPPLSAFSKFCTQHTEPFHLHGPPRPIFCKGPS